MTTDDGAGAFDLTERPWIPVRRRDGTDDELSLRQVFAQAHSGPDGVALLVGDLPTQEFALLRLLLAVLHDALDGPADIDDWHELWVEKTLPTERIDAYLHTHRERFDLLHPRTPFFQVADLHTAKKEHFPLDRIVADVPNGEPFFSMRARGARRLGFAEAARWLVHAHAFDPSGIKSGAVGDPDAKQGKGYPRGVGWAGNLGGVYVEGDDLRETLLLNLVAADFEPVRADEGDRPAWRFPPGGPGMLTGTEAVSRPYGVRDLYTWQSRRVRLFADDEGVYGVLLCYGDPLDAANRQQREPMTGWRRSSAQEKKRGKALIYLPHEHQPARSAWRGLESLLQDQGDTQRGEAARHLKPPIMDWVARLVNEDVLPQDHFIRARSVGARYGTQQSVIDEVTDDRVDMYVALLGEQSTRLRQAAIDAVSDADKAVHALGNLAAGLAEAAGIPADTPRNQAYDRAFGELDGLFRAWLRDLGPQADPEQRRRDWQVRVRATLVRVARDLVLNAGEAAHTGRVVETPQGDLWLSAGRAERRFHRGLAKALPLTVTPPTSKEHE
jgi:CRISPR system Cascade subunit CasA